MQGDAFHLRRPGQRREFEHDFVDDEVAVGRPPRAAAGQAWISDGLEPQAGQHRQRDGARQRGRVVGLRTAHEHRAVGQGREGGVGPRGERVGLCHLPCRRLGGLRLDAGQRRLRIGVVSLDRLDRLGKPLRPLLLEIDTRGFVGGGRCLERRARGGDPLEPLLLEHDLFHCPLRLRLGESGGDRLVIDVHLARHILHRLHLGGPAGAVEDSHEDLVDEQVVVGLAGHQLRQFALGVGQHVAHRGAARQRHDRTERHATRPLALAGAFPRRPAEGLEEAAAEGARHVGQLCGPRAGWVAGELRRRPHHGVQTVEERLGRQPPGQGVGVVDPVIVVPLAAFDRQAVGSRRTDFQQQLPHIEAAVDERLREVVEERRIAGRIARTDVVDRVDDAGAEEIAP